MNNHLKLAYDYGVQQALSEAGITKTAMRLSDLLRKMGPDDTIRALDKWPGASRLQKEIDAWGDALRGGDRSVLDLPGFQGVSEKYLKSMIEGRGPLDGRGLVDLTPRQIKEMFG